jgi:hypothetical protein
MDSKVISINKEEVDSSSEENLSLMEHHNIVAKHYEEAAKHRRAAARSHEIGDHDKAYQHVLKSHGHAYMAMEAQRGESNKQKLIS